MLEAEKETNVNKIADLRTLIKKVNEDGEKRVNNIKNKNVIIFYFIILIQTALKNVIS